MARPVTVLVVEDELSVQRTLCARLGPLGFRAVSATTIDQAVVLLGNERIDAISLDVRLPDPSGSNRSGLTLLALLRATAEYAHVPVVILTGVPLSHAQEVLIRRYHAEVFYKPQPCSVVIERLSRMLAVARPESSQPR